MVVEHKHKIGFKGTILIEPKPFEPTKHQYDHDVATVYGFLQRYGLRGEVKVNIEVNHATLAGHSIPARNRAGRGARHLRLDRHQSRRPTLAGTRTSSRTMRRSWRQLIQLVQDSGFTTGGFNFDAKLRRQSVDPTI